jgi:hypothetical protein
MRRVIFLLLCVPACTDTTPWLEEVGLRLSVDYTGCTEAWLRINVPSDPQGRTIDIVRDGARLQQIQLFSSDTVVVDQGLSPHRVYKYQIFRLQDGKAVEASVPVSVTTMDTTSHDFTWETTTLGDGNSSVLFDVAIINDTLAYAVDAVNLCLRSLGVTAL